MKAQPLFAIRFSRLPKFSDAPGLILLTVDTSNGTEAPRQIGALTDVALRGRLSYYDLHSANELAAIRHALQQDRGQVTVYEGWPGLGSCLRFWRDFVGSQIRPLEWSCESCACENREDVGASVGETFLRACKCGSLRKITITAVLPTF